MKVLNLEPGKVSRFYELPNLTHKKSTTIIFSVYPASAAGPFAFQIVDFRCVV
ncbi:hypothetical protein BDR04DRAFT_1097665 [Suillus decipiens]|nr:hypothetical protein BDR04DRAFT_1097665 [Suillus decipiens]